MTQNESTLEKTLRQCREIAAEALTKTDARTDHLHEILTNFREAVENINAETESIESTTQSVSTTAEDFVKNVEELKSILVHMTSDAISELKKSLKTLEQNANFVTIALFGRTRAGKSTTLEALIKGDGETIGIGKQHTTTEIQEYFWPKGQQTLRIVDTPGVEGFQGDELAKQAQHFVEQADHIFFLVTDDKASAGELEHFANIRSMGKGITVLLNMKKADADLDLVIEMPEFLFDTRTIEEHSQRITQYLERNHELIDPTILPIHARAAWLASKEQNQNLSRQMREVSKIATVEERIKDFVRTEALGARIASPRKMLRTHIVSIQDTLRTLSKQFKGAEEETKKQHQGLEKAVKVATQKSTRRLAELKAPFQLASAQIPELVDGLIVEQGGGKKLQAEWRRVLSSSGVDGIHSKFVGDVEGFFAEELDEQVRRFAFEAKMKMNLNDVESVFERVDELHNNKTFRRLGRAGIKTAGAAAGGALTAWAVANFWNPSGWIAGIGAFALTAAGVVAGNQGAGALADEWSKQDRRNLQNHRSDIVQKLEKKLWGKYRETNDICFDWLGNYEKSLLSEIESTLGLISRSQRLLYQAVQDSIDNLNSLLNELELDVLGEFAAQVIPEIADNNIHITRTARWDGYCTKFLVDSQGLSNIIGRCIGRGGERTQKLRSMLGGEYVAWVQADLPKTQQIAQALSPARVREEDINWNVEEQTAHVEIPSNQMGRAIGANGANVKTASRLLQIKHIQFEEKEK